MKERLATRLTGVYTQVMEPTAPATIPEAQATDAPGSVAFLAQQQTIIVEPARPGVHTESMTRLAAAIRRAAKRTGCPVHVEFTGTASLRVRAAR